MSTEPKSPGGGFLEVALEYAAAGFSVVPAARSGKTKRAAVASWKPYQSEIADTETLHGWFGEAGTGNAIAVICGGVSGGLEVIDFDQGGAAFSAWADLVNERAPGLLFNLKTAITPSGGRHAIYRHDGPPMPNRRLASNADGVLIETRGEGGLILCAPSPGYEFVGVNPGLENVLTITAAEREILLDAAAELDEQPEPARPADAGQPGERTRPEGQRTRPGDDFTERTDVRELLARYGWSHVGGKGENEYWRRPGKEDDGHSGTLHDERGFYVFSTSAAPLEAGRTYDAFGLLAAYEHGGDFAAAGRALAAKGYGKTPETGDVDLSALEASLTPPPPATEAKSLAELVTTRTELRPPLIRGLLRVGETMNVIAPPKSHKSWLVLDLALSVATGRDFLGHTTVASDVLVLDNELHEETIASRVREVQSRREIPMSAVGERVFFQSLRGNLQDFDSLASCLAPFAPGRFGLVVLDAFYRFLPVGSDENDNATIAGIYNKIDRLADLHQCSFALIHHTSKGNQAGKGVTDVGAGAGAQSRATDAHLILREHEEPGVSVLDAAVRSWAPVEPRCLRWEWPLWTPDDSLDPADLKGPGRRKKKDDEPDPAAVWTPARVAESFLSGTPKTAAIERVANETPLSLRRARASIELAIEEGHAVAIGGGGPNPVRLWWSGHPDKPQTEEVR